MQESSFLGLVGRSAAMLELFRQIEMVAPVSRAHILDVFRSTGGIVAGAKGAAVRLGMKRSTLNFRMKKLGTAPRGGGDVATANEPGE